RDRRHARRDRCRRPRTRQSGHGGSAKRIDLSERSPRMTQDQTQPSAALLSRISADLRPVTASPVPSRVQLRVAPVAVVAAPAILFSIGLRRDATTLGPLLTWGASLVLVALGLLLVW